MFNSDSDLNLAFETDPNKTLDIPSKCVSNPLHTRSAANKQLLKTFLLLTLLNFESSTFFVRILSVAF